MKIPRWVITVLGRVATAVVVILCLPADLFTVLFIGRTKFWSYRIRQASKALDIEKPLDDFYMQYAKDNYSDFIKPK